MAERDRSACSTPLRAARDLATLYISRATRDPSLVVRRTKTRAKEELDALVEDATVDCHDEGEQLMSLANAIDEHLAVPFETTVLGVAVTVATIEATERDIVAVCRRGRHRQRVSVLDLPLPRPEPAGSEWIAAYRHWAGRR